MVVFYHNVTMLAYLSPNTSSELKPAENNKSGMEPPEMVPTGLDAIAFPNPTSNNFSI